MVCFDGNSGEIIHFLLVYIIMLHAIGESYHFDPNCLPKCHVSSFAYIARELCALVPFHYWLWIYNKYASLNRVTLLRVTTLFGGLRSP
jgi:hypothetical protein